MQVGRTNRLKILMDSKHCWESQNQREQLTEGMMEMLVMTRNKQE